MKELIETLRRNSIIKSLMDEFKKDFKNTYYDATLKQKEMLIDYRDVIFRRWLYSPLRGGTYLTPSYIINNIAQQIYPGDYCIMPYIKVDLDNEGRLKFYRKFNYHSFNNSPVINDLEKLIDFLKPTIIVRDENKYVIDGGERLINRLSIQSDYYIEYLINIATNIGILEPMKSIGCRCYKIGKDYYNYINLKIDEKIKIIINSSIDIVRESISDIIEFDNTNSIFDLLDNGVTEEKFFQMMKPSLKETMEHSKCISDSLKVDEKTIYNITEEVLSDEIGYWLVRREAGIYLDTYLTCILGYYLGIINPIYDELFLTKIFIDFISYTDNPIERLSIIFTMELGHNLTRFGEKFIMERKIIKENNFKALLPKNIKCCIEEYKNKKDNILYHIHD